MVIEINENYFIKIDNYNTFLMQSYWGKDQFEQPKEFQKSLGSFRTVDQALVFLARQQVLDDHETLTLGEYVQTLKDNIQALREVCQI